MENKKDYPYEYYFELGIRIPFSSMWYHANFFNVATLKQELIRFNYYSLPLRICVFRYDNNFVEEFIQEEFLEFFKKYE